MSRGFSFVLGEGGFRIDFHGHSDADCGKARFGHNVISVISDAGVVVSSVLSLEELPASLSGRESCGAIARRILGFGSAI